MLSLLPLCLSFLDASAVAWNASGKENLRNYLLHLQACAGGCSAFNEVEEHVDLGVNNEGAEFLASVTLAVILSRCYFPAAP